MTNALLIDAIAQADSIIDGYLGALYVVPVVNDSSGVPYVTTPHPLDFWSRDLAAYYATLTYRRSQDFTDQDPIARRFNATMLALNATAKGTMVLSIPGNASDTAGEGAGSPINVYGGRDMFQPRDFSLIYGHDAGFPWGFGGNAYLSQLDYPWPT